MCNVSFWSDTNDAKGTGPYKNYTSPTSVPDLEKEYWDGTSRTDDMKDDMSWVDTAENTWVRIFSSTYYNGRTLLIGPNSHVNLKYTNDEGNQGNMNDTVQSFQLYDHKPIDTTAITNNFIALFPQAPRGREGYAYYSTFYAQDSEYRIFDPAMVVGTDSVVFTLKLKHMQAEGDDEADVTFSMDYSGGFVDQIQVTYKMADETQIPAWAIKLIDGAIDATAWAAKAVADSAEIVLTDGAGLLAAPETNEVIDGAAKALTFCVDHLNTVLAGIFKYQDNGGTMYFSSMVSHGIARLVLAYYQELMGADKQPAMTFNESRFRSGLNAGGWVNPGTSGGKSNPYVDFTQNEYSYRAFYPDNSFLYGHMGAVSSVCIGANTGLQKDDHLTLQVGCDPQGNLFCATGGMDIFLTRSISGYQAPTTGVIMKQGTQVVRVAPGSSPTPVSQGNIVDAYRDAMNAALNAAESEYGLDFTDQQKHLVDASVTVLNAIVAAIA
jgi:hypothetical protein